MVEAEGGRGGGAGDGSGGRTGGDERMGELEGEKSEVRRVLRVLSKAEPSCLACAER